MGQVDLEWPSASRACGLPELPLSFINLRAPSSSLRSLRQGCEAFSYRPMMNDFCWCCLMSCWNVFFVMFSCGFTNSTAFLGICRTWACFNRIILSASSPQITSLIVAQVLCCARVIHTQINPMGHPVILPTSPGPLTDLIITLLHKHYNFAREDLCHLLNMHCSRNMAHRGTCTTCGIFWNIRPTECCKCN